MGYKKYSSDCVLGNVDVISDLWISNITYRLIFWVVKLLLPWNEWCHCTSFMLATFVHTMVWCCQPTSHCQKECWWRYPVPYGVKLPQRVIVILPCNKICLCVSKQLVGYHLTWWWSVLLFVDCFTYSGLVTPYGVGDLCQHWFR